MDVSCWYSWSPDDESFCICWSPDLFFVAPPWGWNSFFVCFYFCFFEWNISTTTIWEAMKFGSDIHGLFKMNCTIVNIRKLTVHMVNLLNVQPLRATSLSHHTGSLFYICLPPQIVSIWRSPRAQSLSMTCSHQSLQFSWPKNTL